MLIASVLYESLALRKYPIISGWATKYPKRSPANP